MDKLAAEGKEKKSKDKDAFISFAWIEHQAREERLKEWTEMWEEEKGKNGKHYLATPATRNQGRLPPGDRKTSVTLSQLRT